MDLRITKEEHPNLFRLICENVACNCKAERWFVEFGKFLMLSVVENIGKRGPYYIINHTMDNVLDGAAIETSLQWLQENLKDEALVEYFLLRQKRSKNDNH